MLAELAGRAGGSVWAADNSYRIVSCFWQRRRRQQQQQQEQGPGRCAPRGRSTLAGALLKLKLSSKPWKPLPLAP